jgi:hypothetical protein
MMNPFDMLLQDCAEGLYTNAQIKSLARAFETFLPWYGGKFMGRTGKQVNPAVLVSSSGNYKLFLNLLVFLKKYYIPKQPTLTLRRLHGSTSEVKQGQTLMFKSLGALSSWTLKDKPNILGRVNGWETWNFLVEAKVPSANIMWTPATGLLLGQANYDAYSFDQRKAVLDLVFAMTEARFATRSFEREEEVIVMSNTPMRTRVLKIVGKP